MTITEKRMLLEHYCEKNVDGCEKCILMQSGWTKQEDDDTACWFLPKHEGDIITPDDKVEKAYDIVKAHQDADPVNHPSHYRLSNGVQVIQITEQLNFCRGNAVKYLCRAGLKDPDKELEDLRKAQWYIDREIQRMEAAQ